MDRKYFLVITTLPDLEKGKEISRVLVKEKLAACVNLIPGLTSIYWWKGDVTEDKEVIALIKTNSDRLEQLMERLRQLHPYELPEILVLEIKEGLKAYLNWIDTSVSS
ncbi:MAG: divalent-cation tolerance protein CutA [Metallosphaera yellowstonensis]|jgi:periplasmic divalent cation tolerance protein